MIETAKTEKEMRDAEAPWPKTADDLAEYIESLVNREHDYGTCVYAMSLAAEAAFHYVAHKVGATGFQAGCAGMIFLGKVNGIHGPFAIIKGEAMLYPPQDSNIKNVMDLQSEWKPWAVKRAEKLLEEIPEAHPDIIAHWENLVHANPTEPAK